MVDVDSALRASAYSGKKGKGSPGAGEKASTELEPFDPSSQAEKEKADEILPRLFTSIKKLSLLRITAQTSIGMN